MSKIPPSPSNSVRGFPIWFGLTGTFASLLIGWLVWLDNLKGFRDAGNFSTLLSAVFSMIATTWLIVTVLRQGEELKLQREELRLQRDETKRIADEAREQSGFLRAQIKISHQNLLIEQIRSIFSSYESEFRADVLNLFKQGNDYFSEITDLVIDSRHFFIEPEESQVVFKLYDKFVHEHRIPKEDMFYKVNYQDISVSVDNSRYRLLRGIHDSSQDYDCSDWFLNELSYTAGGTEKITAKQIRILLNLAVNKSVR